MIYYSHAEYAKLCESRCDAKFASDKFCGFCDFCVNKNRFMRGKPIVSV